MDAMGPEDCAPPGNLPGAHDTADQLRAVFYRMGFNDADIVTLLGAHTLGHCHPANSGFSGPWSSNPYSFDNLFYITLLSANFTNSGSQWDSTDGTMCVS